MKKLMKKSSLLLAFALVFGVNISNAVEQSNGDENFDSLETSEFPKLELLKESINAALIATQSIDPTYSRKLNLQSIGELWKEIPYVCENLTYFTSSSVPPKDKDRINMLKKDIKTLKKEIKNTMNEIKEIVVKSVEKKEKEIGKEQKEYILENFTINDDLSGVLNKINELSAKNNVNEFKLFHKLAAEKDLDEEGKNNYYIDHIQKGADEAFRLQRVNRDIVRDIIDNVYDKVKENSNFRNALNRIQDLVNQ